VEYNAEFHIYLFPTKFALPILNTVAFEVCKATAQTVPSGGVIALY